VAAITIEEKAGTYTCTIPLKLKDGRTLYVQGKASVQEVANELGFSPQSFEEVGGIFGSIGKFFKKIAKSKAVRKALKITKSIVKNPITTAALGVVTGGASVPFTAAASAGLRLADMAKKGGKAGRAARRTIKASMRASKKQQARKKAALKRKLAAKKAMRTQGRIPKAIRRGSTPQKRYDKKKQLLKAAVRGELKKLPREQQLKAAKILGPYVRTLKFV
jgi:hypothetical protein